MIRQAQKELTKHGMWDTVASESAQAWAFRLIKYGGIKNGQTEKIIAVIGFNSNIDFGIDILRI